MGQHLDMQPAGAAGKNKANKPDRKSPACSMVFITVEDIDAPTKFNIGYFIIYLLFISCPSQCKIFSAAFSVLF